MVRQVFHFIDIFFCVFPLNCYILVHVIICLSNSDLMTCEIREKHLFLSSSHTRLIISILDQHGANGQRSVRARRNGSSFVSVVYHFSGCRFVWEMQRWLQQERFPKGLRFRSRHFCLSGLVTISRVLEFVLQSDFDQFLLEPENDKMESGKELLTKTGESQASGTLSLTLVPYLFLFLVF